MAESEKGTENRLLFLCVGESCSVKSVPCSRVNAHGAREWRAAISFVPRLFPQISSGVRVHNDVLPAEKHSAGRQFHSEGTCIAAPLKIQKNSPLAFFKVKESSGLSLSRH
jgi:hypothetical protein